MLPKSFLNHGRTWVTRNERIGTTLPIAIVSGSKEKRPVTMARGKCQTSKTPTLPRNPCRLFWHLETSGERQLPKPIQRSPIRKSRICCPKFGGNAPITSSSITETEKPENAKNSKRFGLSGNDKRRSGKSESPVLPRTCCFRPWQVRRHNKIKQ